MHSCNDLEITLVQEVECTGVGEEKVEDTGDESCVGE